MTNAPAHIKPKKDAEAEFEAASDEAKLAMRLTQLRAKKEDLKQQLEDTNKLLQQADEELVALMEAKQIDLFRIRDVGTFYTQTKNHPSVTKDNQEAFIAWLDENGMGELAKRAVHSMTLLGWVNDWMKQGKSLPSCVSNFAQKTVIVRKA